MQIELARLVHCREHECLLLGEDEGLVASLHKFTFNFPNPSFPELSHYYHTPEFSSPQAPLSSLQPQPFQRPNLQPLSEHISFKNFKTFLFVSIFAHKLHYLA